MRCKAARHSFSLLEVMIALVLVGVIAGFSAFSLVPFYQSYRFKLEVEALYELLQELQLEALTLQSDIEVSFTKKNVGWIVSSSSGERVLKPQTIDLSHVEQISDSGMITLYSSGRIEQSPCRNPIPSGVGKAGQNSVNSLNGGVLQKAKTIKLSYKSDQRWLDFSGGHLIKLLETAPQPIVFEKLPDLGQFKKMLVEKEKK